jgi:hypothetical protein
LDSSYGDSIFFSLFVLFLALVMAFRNGVVDKIWVASCDTRVVVYFALQSGVGLICIHHI